MKVQPLRPATARGVEPMEELSFVYLSSQLGRSPTLEECRALGIHSIATCCAEIVAGKRPSEEYVVRSMICYYSCCRIMGQKIGPADKPTFSRCSTVFNASRCISIMISSQPHILYNSFVSSFSVMCNISVRDLNDIVVCKTEAKTDKCIEISEVDIVEAETGKENTTEKAQEDDGSIDGWGW